jgi:XrtJ-associated TM-motif-TM protein
MAVRRMTLNKIRTIVPILLLLFAAAVRVHAQSGCDDSPENPTAVLGLIVGVASLGYVRVRNHLRARNRSELK